jgi:hypothetical protein
MNREIRCGPWGAPPARRHNTADFVIDDSTLDNVFISPVVLQNDAKLLRQSHGIDTPLPCVRTGRIRLVSHAREDIGARS